VRALSPEEFGVASLALAIATFIPLLTSGFNNAFHRYYFDPKIEDKERVVTTILFLEGGLSLLLNAFLAGIFVLFPDLFGLNLSSFWLIIPLAANVFQLPLIFSVDLLRFSGSPWKSTLLSLSQAALQGGMTLFFLFVMEWGVKGYLLSLAGSFFLLSALCLPFLLSKMKGIFKGVFDRELSRDVLSFSFPFAFTALAYWLFTAGDKIILGQLSSLKEVGLYTAALKFVTPLTLGAVAFNKALYPQVMESYQKGENYQHEAQKGLIWGLISQLILALMIFSGAPFLIGTILPESYRGVEELLPYLLLGAVMLGMSQVASIGIMIDKKPFLMTIGSWVAAIISVSLNFLLIPIWGGAGAAVGSICTSLALTTSYLLFSSRLFLSRLFLFGYNRSTLWTSTEKRFW